MFHHCQFNLICKYYKMIGHAIKQFAFGRYGFEVADLRAFRRVSSRSFSACC